MAFPNPCQQEVTLLDGTKKICGQVHETFNGKEACPGHIIEKEHPEKGRPCRHEAGWGTGYVGIPGMYCKRHGGAVRSHQTKAQNYLLQQEIDQQFKLLGIEGNFEPITDPYDFLANLAGEIAYVKDRLREKVEALPTLEDVGSDKLMTQLQVTVQAYERFLTHCAKLGTDMSRLDLDARIAKRNALINEELSNIIQHALQGALSDVSLTPEDRDRVLSGFGRRLRGTPEPEAIAS